MFGALLDSSQAIYCPDRKHLTPPQFESSIKLPWVVFHRAATSIEKFFSTPTALRHVGVAVNHCHDRDGKVTSFVLRHAGSFLVCVRLNPRSLFQLPLVPEPRVSCEL
jgi:hypothetical protein